MSDMEAAKIRLKRLPHLEASHWKNEIQKFGDDDYQINEFLKSRSLMRVNGSIYHATVEKLDPCSFVTKSEGPFGIIELVALWYNGGACLEDMIEEGLKEDYL